jgi:hypothetical protein
MAMTSTLRTLTTLTTGLIDYAGLFPPARLPVDEAFDRFLAHRRGAHGWMLARFVCPAGRLGELEPMLGRIGDGDGAVGLTVLGSGGDSPEAFASGIAGDVEKIRSIAARTTAMVGIDQYETRLPQRDQRERLGELVSSAVRSFEDVLGDTVLPFFETSLLGGWAEELPAAVEAVAAAAEILPAGLKIRCGGADADAFPTPAAVAEAVVAARNAGIPLKATQGLHHPFRHYDSRIETMSHGFLNLFIAGVLCHALDLEEPRVRELIEEEDAEAFVFSEPKLGWRDATVTPEQIAEARRAAVTSFGSCSFSEPVDDLIRLGLLE